MNCYKEMYDRLVSEIKELEASRESTLLQYNDLSGRYKDLINRYNNETMSIDSEWQKEINKFLKNLFKLFSVNLGMSLIFIIINVILSLTSTKVMFIIAALIFIISSSASCFYAGKKHSKTFESFNSRKNSIEKEYEDDLKFTSVNLKKLSNTLSDLGNSISDRRDKANFLIMSYGKLCLGISDSEILSNDKSNVYIKKRTINDKN